MCVLALVGQALYDDMKKKCCWLGEDSLSVCQLFGGTFSQRSACSFSLVQAQIQLAGNVLLCDQPPFACVATRASHRNRLFLCLGRSAVQRDESVNTERAQTTQTEISLGACA